MFEFLDFNGLSHFLDKIKTLFASKDELANKMNKNNPTGTGSFSMNRKVGSAVGDYSTTEGNNCIASGDCSHAEGDECEAYDYSHAEGVATKAHSRYSHTEGSGTTTLGNGAHAEGFFTIASSNYQHVQGQWNVEDTEHKYAHIVGNGDVNNGRSNAHTLDWDGNAEFAGDVIANGCGGENPVSLVGLNESLNNKADKTNPTITWNVNVGTDAEQTFELRKNGVSPTEGLSIVKTDKDGNKVFYSLLDHTGKFLPSINDKINAIGTIYEVNLESDINIKDKTSTSVVSLILPKGTYVVTYYARFASNSSGYRAMNCRDEKNSSGFQCNTVPVSGSVTHMKTANIMNFNSQRTIYLNVYQSSGSDLKCLSGNEITGIKAIKIS